MKNIFIISNNAWNLYNFRFELIQSLSKENNLILFCNKDIYANKLLINKNIQIVNCNFKKNNLNFLKDLYLLINIFFKVIKFKPSYILSFTLKPNLYSLVIALFFNVKVINNITGLGSIFLKGKIYNLILSKIYKFLLKRSHYIFFQNSFDKEEICKNDQILLNKSDVLPGSGINLEKFVYSELKSNNRNYTFIGRIIKDKGVLELFNVIKKIKKTNNINFEVIGDLDLHNPSYLTIEFLNHWRDLKIFDYYPNQDNIINFLENTQCLILPSYREGCSKIIMEAMAIGRPVIATNVPGCNNLIQNGVNGFLVESKNEVDLHKTILKFNDLSYNQKLLMGKNSRNIIEKSFDINNVLYKYLNLIK